MSILDSLRKSNQIARLQGKEYVLFSGLLELSQKEGREGWSTEVVSHNPGDKVAHIRCTVKGKRGTYTAHGDASPANVSRNILPSYFRMAETRAICRALRFYLGIGMTARDELPPLPSDEKQSKKEGGENIASIAKSQLMQYNLRQYGDIIAGLGIKGPAELEACEDAELLSIVLQRVQEAAGQQRAAH